MNKEEVLNFIKRYEGRMFYNYGVIRDNPEEVIEDCIYMMKDLSENKEFLSRKTFNRLNANSRALEEAAVSSLK